MSPKRNLAVIEMLLATAGWGFGFVATIWALRAVDAFELTLIRFALAGLLGLPFVILAFRKGEGGKLASLSFVPGVFLTGTLVLQTWGLQFTSPTKSAFITTLYVVFVPLVEIVHLKKPMGWKIWACVSLALIGTALIVDLGFSALNFGDVLTFLCALCATGQIYWMGQVSRRISRPFAFNILQTIWSIPLILPLVNLSVVAHKVANVANWPREALAGTLFLAIASTMIAFFLQVRAQAKLSATVSSLLFLLESPFALIFSILFLSKSLTLMESAGAVLIFASAIWATRLEAAVLHK